MTKKQALTVLAVFFFLLTMRPPYYTIEFIKDVSEAMWRDMSVVVIFMGLGVIWNIKKWLLP